MQALTAREWDQLFFIVKDAAEKAILPRFRALGAGDIASKSRHDDLVTLADTEAEALMTDAIRAAWPEARVIGEEAISQGMTSTAELAKPGRTFVLDPVDGTWNFAKGLATFGMIVAVVEDGATIGGLLYDPLFDDAIYAGAGDAAARHRRPGAAETRLRTAPQKPAEELNGFAPLGLLPTDQRPRVVEAMKDLSRFYALRCSCHEYRLLAQGHADFILTAPDPNVWDHAAGALIAKAGGGVTRMLDGRDYRPEFEDSYILTAASEEVWSLVAGRLGFLLG